MIRAMGAVLLVGCGWAQDAPGTLVRELSGVADAATADGEAKTLDKEGIYCWWVSPKIRPGYFQVIARARTTGAAGVLHFVLTDSADENRVSHAITETRAGRVTSEEYEEIYCGSFHWDGSYGARISDWSTPGLMVDWVKLVPVTAGEIRDPLPGALKQYEAPRFGGRTASDLEIRPTTADGDADVVIDGELGEWAGVPLLVLGAEEARSADYGGTGDLSATVAFAWNDTHLYFACEATDDSADFLQDGRKLSSIWQHDSIQLAFDAAGNAKTPGYADDDYEYGLGMTADGARVYRWVAGNNLPVGDVPTIDLAVTRDDEAGVTRYEAAIPFKELVPFSPERAQCGVTMVINDRDAGEGQRAWLEWTPGIAGAKDPSAFGILRLIDSPPATTAVTALLIARRDLSVDPDLDASLRVHSAEALGQCALQWRIAREGAVGEVLQRGERAVELEEAGAVIEIPSEATASGLKPLLQDDGTATASDQEIRPTIGGVDIAGLGEGRFVLTAEIARGEEVLASDAVKFFRFDVDGMEDDLEAIEERLAAGLAAIARLREGGAQAQYPRATLGAVEEFSRYAREDIGKARYERADTIISELRELLGEAEAEIAELADHPERDRVAPALPKGRITARDGSFYCGGEPQMLIGYGGWWQVWSRIGPLAEQGLNHLQDSIIAPFALYPDAGEEPDATMMDGLRWGWDKADRAKTVYSRMIACNQVPDAFREQNPGAMGGGWSGMCTLSPELREFEKRYLTTVAKAAAPHDSMGVYVLYGENAHRLTDDPREVAAFHRYLNAQYDSLADLNSTWGTEFGDWDEIGSAKDVDSPVAWYDRGRCSQRLFADWTKWLRDTVNAVDPEALCTGYPSLLSWDDSSDFSAGIDIEALCRETDVNGFDTAALDYGGKRWAMSSITGFAMPHDLVRACNPENPNFDPELHLVNLNQPYPDEYIRAAMLQGCLHGMSAANLWVYQRNEGMDSMLVFQPRVMASYLRAGLDLRRLARPITAFQRAKSEVGILYSLTSVAYNPRHLRQMRAVYEGTFFADTKVGFVTERTAAEGALDGLKLLILPEATHVPTEVAEAIRAWAEEGGTLAMVGDCLQRDEHDRELGIEIEGATQLPASDDPAVHATALEPLIEASVARAYRVAGALDGVEMRAVEVDGRRLFYAINMNKSAVSFDIAPRPASELVELITSEPVQLPMELGSLGVVVLEER